MHTKKKVSRETRPQRPLSRSLSLESKFYYWSTSFEVNHSLECSIEEHSNA
jgi:hypothetical protein